MSRFQTGFRARRLGALACLTALACVPSSAPSGRARPGKSFDEISRAEIEAEGPRFQTAYDLVGAVRPTMLISRTSTAESRYSSPMRQASPGIKVYLDGIAYGGVETLRFIPANTVLNVRWLSALDATTRYGGGNMDGAILVTTKTGRR